jgi:hypothetical protein
MQAAVQNSRRPVGDGVFFGVDFSLWVCYVECDDFY